MKQCIIATGHFTTCYNLLKYLGEKETLSAGETALKELLKIDWERFRSANSEAGLLNACGY